MGGPRTRGFQWRGWFGIAFLVPAIALALLSRPAILEGTVADGCVDIVAWALFVFGVLTRLWSAIYIGGQKGRTLISDGPYSLCRNPLYLGSFLMAISMGLFLKSLLVLAAVAVLLIVYVTYTIPAEESHLYALFGQQYQDYCRHTPRLFPRPRLFRTRELTEIKAAGLGKVFKLVCLWFAMPVACELAQHLRNQPWWPIVFHLP